MDVEQAIRARRTHKQYGARPVDDATVRELVDLARSAPNHKLTNPWRFRVLGPAALERLKQAAPDGAAKLDRAPTLVACSVLQTGDELQNAEDICAGACAVYAVMLAAHERGIATYWRSPKTLREPAGREALGIEDDEHVLGLLHLGFADREWAAPARDEREVYTRFLD